MGRAGRVPVKLLQQLLRAHILLLVQAQADAAECQVDLLMGVPLRMA